MLVRVCQTCDASVDAAALYCACGAFVGFLDLVDRASAPSSAVDGATRGFEGGLSPVAGAASGTSDSARNTLRRTCPTCGERNEASVIFCARCGITIGHVEPAPELADTGARSGAPALDAGVGERPPTGQATCPHCRQEQRPAPRCVRCDLEMCSPPDWFAVWPWGEETLLPSELLIGREASPDWLRRRFVQSGFDNVSRRHAVIYVQGAEAAVTDLGSSNGTFVNEASIGANAARTVASGDSLRFGASLRVTLSRRSTS